VGSSAFFVRIRTHCNCQITAGQGCQPPGQGRYVDNVTPLLLAAENGHDKVAKYLLNFGADIDAARNDGCMPLSLSMATENTSTIHPVAATSGSRTADTCAENRLRCREKYRMKTFIINRWRIISLKTRRTTSKHLTTILIF
jgi:hypothetical protein